MKINLGLIRVYSIFLDLIFEQLINCKFVSILLCNSEYIHPTQIDFV